MGKENIADNLTLGAQLVNGAPEIDGVPEDDGRNGEIEPHSAVTDLSHPDGGDTTSPAIFPRPAKAGGVTGCCFHFSATQSHGEPRLRA